MVKNNILIIEEEKEIFETIKALFENELDYNIITCKPDMKDIKKVMNNIPDIILLNTKDNVNLYNEITKDWTVLMTPMISFSDSSYKEDIIKNLATGFEYYIIKPVDSQYIYYVIKNIIRLINSNRTVSPLTGLPGNIQIENELKRRLLKKEKFSVLYLDLDNFKAYNDTYGFLKGDEVIKLTADIIINNINQNRKMSEFVGHIGGDDFVVITGNDDIEKLCINIINDFDNRIKELLNEDDKERGFFEVPNRRGIIEQFPLTSISIGVVEIESDRKIDRLEIAEIGSQVKHKAKTIPGSAYVISKRMI